jgi:hypothetical protein
MLTAGKLNQLTSLLADLRDACERDDYKMVIEQVEAIVDDKCDALDAAREKMEQEEK